MAALEENSLSPWHLSRTDRETLRTATKGGERSLKRSEHRRMELQRDASTSQRDQHLRAVELQRRWLQLQERERKARLRNKQLLQDFERAQDTLRDMVTRTATMKTIRMEYERYLEENSPRWQQQLKEKTLSAQKRMEVYLTEYLKKIEEEQVMMPSAEAQPSLSQGPPTQPQKTAADKHPGYYSQNSCPHYDKDGPSRPPAPSMQSSWPTHCHPHSAGFPSRTPCQPQGSSHAPSAFHPLPSFQQPHRFTSTPSHHHSLPQPRPLGWTPLQMDHARSRSDGVAGFPAGHEALWARPFMAEPPGWGVMQGVEVGAERSTGPSSERGSGRGGRSSGLSQELDVKPVRLSSESGRDSSQGSRKSGGREKRRRRAKTGRTERSSSAGEEDGSQESSGASSTVVAASASVAQGSESDTSSGKGSSSSRTQRGRRRSAGLSVKPPRMETTRERTSSEGEGDDSESDKEASPVPQEDSGSQKEGPRSERQGNQSPDNKSESCGEESGSPAEKSERGSEKTEDEGAEGSEEQESSRGDKDEEGEGREKEAAETDKDGDDDDDDDEESSLADDEEEDKLEDDDDEKEAPGRNSTAEEEEEVEEHECEGSEKDEDVSQDGEMEEGVRKGSADKTEEDEEESDEEEDEEEKQRSQEPEEDRDSEDSIIVPQAPRSKTIIHSIPEEEEATGDEEDDDDDDDEQEGETESSDEFKDEDDDIESLLAPQAETQKKKENVPKAEDKPKAIVEDLENVSMELGREKNTAEDDSDEFDHFYD
ncbi:protein starmaker isoform X2 [Myripristis murdjan]|uniref:protein starmaker isoform X2 n=1 Tax=Myripristis murdjan TaxID=586833 RepID=UPI0011762247|nr:protein starmaker-like isoform X2 [Myripristis murdjan]